MTPSYKKFRVIKNHHGYTKWDGCPMWNAQIVKSYQLQSKDWKCRSVSYQIGNIAFDSMDAS